MVYETMQDRIERLGHSYSFYAYSPHRWTVYSRSDLDAYFSDPLFCLAGAVEPRIDVCDDKDLGDEILQDLRVRKPEDAIPFISFYNTKMRMLSLAWISEECDSFAGVVLYSSEGVFFIYTHTYLNACGDNYYRTKHPPYYMWDNPWLVQFYGLGHPRQSEFISFYQAEWSDTSSLNGFWCAIENYLTAFKLDISPERLDFFKEHESKR